MTSYKKLFLILLCTLTLWLSYPKTIHADIGPKPSVTITFEGDIPEEYYATLLSQQKSTGPATAYDGTNPQYTAEDEEYAIWQKFVNYEDTDGFYFLQEFWNCTDQTSFRWGYYPPQTFKVLVYIPATDTFIVSDIYECYAFETYYSINLDTNNIVKNYNSTWEIISLVARIVLTILIEVAIAWILQIRSKKDLKTIIIVNVITQIGLNVALNIINFFKGQWAFTFYYAVLEIAILFIEAVIYKKVSIKKATIYAMLANIISFVFGLWLAHIIPGIF